MPFEASYTGDDWYYDTLARMTSGAQQANAAAASQPSPVGTAVGRYVTSAIQGDPRLPAIMQNISGTISPDVQRQIAQAAAERGIATGSYGGGQDQSAYLRALGLTSQDLINRGIEQYAQLYGQVPKIAPESYIVPASQQAQMEFTRQQNVPRTSPRVTLPYSGPVSAPIATSGPLARSVAGPDNTMATIDALLGRLRRGAEPETNGQVTSQTWGGYTSQPRLTAEEYPDWEQAYYSGLERELGFPESISPEYSSYDYYGPPAPEYGSLEWLYGQT